MKITNVEFFGSAVRYDQYPKDNLSEIVLSGRSNVGKSTFINTLLNRKNEARVSSKPGKTQTLNFFKINNQFYFVDVPGYGYAKVSKEKKEQFGKIIEEYLTNRENLKAVILLVDFRHKPTEDDCIMYNYLTYYQIPVVVVATKVDKIGSTHFHKHKKQIMETLHVNDDMFIPYSSVTNKGVEKIWNTINQFVSSQS